MSDTILRSKITERVGPITIPAGQTVIVDTIAYAKLVSLDYNISIKDTVSGKYRAFVSTVTKKNSNVSDYISDKTGDYINASVNVSLNVSDVELAVTNNEVNDISLFYLKTKIGE